MGQEVVVIGAGINGLVAANCLRRAGLEVLQLEKNFQVGGACTSAEIVIDGQEYTYPPGATVLGLMPNFIFEETGLANMLTTYIPSYPSIVDFETLPKPTLLYRNASQLQAELREKWGETGDLAGFTRDKARVINFLRTGFKAGRAPSLEEADLELGHLITDLWIKGSARNLLNRYLSSDYTKLYQALAVVESGPVSLDEPYSAFNIPLISSGNVFDGYWGYVKGGLWQLPRTLNHLNTYLGVTCLTKAEVKKVSNHRVTYEQGNSLTTLSADRVVFATDPLNAARLLGDTDLEKLITQKRLLGTSGKLVQIFRSPLLWTDLPNPEAWDSALRFFISSSSLDEFEAKTQSVVSGKESFSHHHFQVYAEGVAGRQMNDKRGYETVTTFFKDLAWGKIPSLEELKRAVSQIVLSRIKNPQDLMWSRLLTPMDISETFGFSQGNIDHIQLANGQNFADRTFSSDPSANFYQFGDRQYIYYCGAGAYPCGSVAGIPGYMCAQEIIRTNYNSGS